MLLAVTDRFVEVMKEFDYKDIPGTSQLAHEKVHGSEYFIMLCTDNGGGCARGRRLTMSEPHHNHLVEQRCVSA